MQCKKCGLHFRYSDDAESTRSRSTAAILARVGGMLGLHHFYLGYYVFGAVRLALFLGLCGFFVGPQIVNIFQTGRFRVVMDFTDIAGLIFLTVNIISYILAIIESMRITEGVVKTDSKGFVLR